MIIATQTFKVKGVVKQGIVEDLSRLAVLLMIYIKYTLWSNMAGQIKQIINEPCQRFCGFSWDWLKSTVITLKS